MERDDEQQLMDGTPSAEITRREAMKKIGKYGLYVPATMAVLTAAPRAFAQSPDFTELRGTVRYSTGAPATGVQVYANQGAVSLGSDIADSSGLYSIMVPMAVEGQVDIGAVACTGGGTFTVHPGVNEGLDFTTICA